ncbi:MAG: 7-cyano-7-deazaguanine synthase QueC [SAR324 cluster bacterium]|uniref:7-cyano-7-deazaguanine synthase n=1 Tax=SAR324 cluster bacterium TaxID=2024889 RepID=A0A2A4T6U4_9DELT|nr:MAG: 7-cyano-7-deazaguanine synthase QueC [SAR324 cluster bacterium]
MSKALVIFSGGQDSTTCLGWAKNRYDSVQAITFAYGQTHTVEVEQAKKIAAMMDVPLQVVHLDFFGDLVNSALISGGDVNAPHVDNEALPASYVPNRNALFILVAHAFSQKIKADTLIGGMCQTDYSGYPDCREDFINTLKQALNMGSEQNIKVETPLMFLNKAETFELARKEGVLDLVLQHSHTCYNGDPNMNEWGRGCGDCPACGLREKGYYEFKEQFGV